MGAKIFNIEISKESIIELDFEDNELIIFIKDERETSSILLNAEQIKKLKHFLQQEVNL